MGLGAPTGRPKWVERQDRVASAGAPNLSEQPPSREQSRGTALKECDAPLLRGPSSRPAAEAMPAPGAVRLVVEPVASLGRPEGKQFRPVLAQPGALLAPMGSAPLDEPPEALRVVGDA